MNLSKDEMDPPTWMNGQFFKDVLNVCKKGYFSKFVKHQITPATVAGDHFASIMFRAKITYLDNEDVEKEITLIIKTMPDAGLKKDMLQDSKIFETEIRMYRDIIPELEKILREAGDNTVLGAKMLYWSLSPQKIIIFEDITQKKFQTIGHRRATLEEAQLAFDKLAKWHAASFYYNIKSGGALESFEEGIFTLPAIQREDFFLNGIKDAVTLVKTLPGFEEYVPKLEKIGKTLIKKCCNTYTISKGSVLNVLNHGDFHAKNMMFKYNENGKVEDVMLVDFQICVWSSMAIDLIYSMYTMTDTKTRVKHMDEIRYNFFNKFIETLKKIGYKGKLPVYTDLQIEFIKYHYIEIFLVVTFLPFLHALGDQSEKYVMESSELICDNKLRNQLYNQQSYIDELKMLLPIFLYKGYLDGYDED